MRRAPERIVNHRERQLDILCDTVNSNALDNGVDLMSSSGTLALLGVEHDPMLYLRIFIIVLSTANSKSKSRLTYLIVKTTAFWIRKHHKNVIRH